MIRKKRLVSVPSDDLRTQSEFIAALFRTA